METKLEPKGVEGWLLLLCFVLIIFSPILTLGGIVNTLQSMKENHLFLDRHPGLYSVLRADIILSSIVCYYGINAGWALYKINVGAVKKVKNYFIIATAYQIASFLLPMTVEDLPKEYIDSISNEGSKQTIKSLLSIAVWYLYIVKSKRVKNTYLT